MTDLAAHIRATPLADTHEHLGTHGALAQHKPDILRELFDGGYITADLIVAGADPKAVERLVAGTDPDIAGRFHAVETAWQRCQHTGYGEGVRLTARIVYGVQELSAAALAVAQTRNQVLREPGTWVRLLREVANLDYVDVDDATWPVRPEPVAPEFFLGDISWVGFCKGEVPVPAIRDEVGIEVRNLETLREALTAIFAKYGPLAIAVKAQHAYERTLQWQERDEADVTRVLDKHLRGDKLAEPERLCLGDWCWARGVELATQHNLPFKMHTGYYAGQGYMILERTRPAHLCPLLVRYPQARFVLMHAGYPFGPELIALAKHFPNVYADLCWAWSMDPQTTLRFVREFLHSAPLNKLFAFGGDTWWPPQSVGYAAQCRKWLTRALQAVVDAGDFTERQALDVATRIMGGNQHECFDVAGRRATLRAAAQAA
jgi:hypothetical protein